MKKPKVNRLGSHSMWNTEACEETCDDANLNVEVTFIQLFSVNQSAQL